MISLETEAKDGAAALIFGALLMLHVLLVFLESVMTRPRMSVEEAALVKEIKGLTRQAIFFSTPSTFAKSAKLKRAAVQKEKELAELRRKVKHEVHWWSYVSSSLPTLLKAGAYIFALWWFWLTPVATVPFQLISPFDKLISTKSSIRSSDYVRVSIVPWLVLSSRVSTFVSKRICRR